MAVKIGYGNIDNTTSLTSAIKSGLAHEKFIDRKGRFWASDCGLCSRRAVLSANSSGYSIVSPSMEVYFELGKKIETIILESLEKTGNLLFADYRIPDIDMNLGGRVDGIILDNGKIKALEIKSCGALPTRPKPAHKAQALIYSAITGLPGSLLYLSRHVAGFDKKLMMQEFKLDDEQEKYDAMFSLAYAAFSNDLNVLPGKGIHKISHCGFCKYIPNCWHDASFDSSLEHIPDDLAPQIMEEADSWTEEFMRPEEVAKRRSNVLLDIMAYGEESAKDILRANK